MKAVRRAQTTQVLKEGRYEIGIPWKDGEPKFKNNYDMAYSRLKNLEISLSKKPEIASAYGKIIEDCLEKGYIEKIPSTNDEQWLSPHFGVVNNEKTSTKVCIVLDAAAKHNGKNLNEAIFPGPKRELVDVLTRSRKAPVAISADISQMFLQVGLIEEDRPYHRFLWRDLDQTKQPEVYDFQRLPFGSTASPFCVQHVLHSHAEANKNTFPEAADTVVNAMYVDDILDSCETIASLRSRDAASRRRRPKVNSPDFANCACACLKIVALCLGDAAIFAKFTASSRLLKFLISEATGLRRQTTELIVGAGFTLKKWMSNEVKVIEDIPIEDRLPGLKIEDRSLPAMKILGVLWRADRDTCSFQIQPPSPSELATKRNVLRAFAKLFEPLQILAPFTIRAKILLQKIWIAGLEWDEVLPDDFCAQCSSWTNELMELSCFEIPRILRLANPTQSSLHTFSDASKDACAAASYLVCTYNNHPTTSRLIASKSCVSLLISVTIPCSELMGAFLACRLAKSLLETLQVDKATY